MYVALWYKFLDETVCDDLRVCSSDLSCLGGSFLSYILHIRTAVFYSSQVRVSVIN